MQPDQIGPQQLDPQVMEFSRKVAQACAEHGATLPSGHSILVQRIPNQPGWPWVVAVIVTGKGNDATVGILEMLARTIPAAMGGTGDPTKHVAALRELIEQLRALPPHTLEGMPPAGEA
jgi:hypothetical protein